MSHDKGIKINNLDDLIYSLNLYSIEQYVGLNKLNSTRPDRMIIDLDPPKNNPNLCIKVAKEVKKLLDKIGIQGYPMTTGSKGLHIIIPIKPNLEYKEVRSICKDIGSELVSLFPNLVTLDYSLKSRVDKVLFDYTRNSDNQVTIVPYSLRATDDCKIAVPISWEEVDYGILDKWNISNIDERLKINPFPWLNYKVNDLKSMKLNIKDKEFSFLTNMPYLEHAGVITHSVDPSRTKFDEKFKPTYTPLEMLRMGVFGGSYFRDPKMIGNTPKVIFTLDKKLWGMPDPDPSINHYKVLAGLDLNFWTDKNLIHPDDPAGWFQWYIKYYYGRRHPDDQRQIRRWRSFVARHGAQAYGNPRYIRQRQALLQWAWNADLDPRMILNN
jgi:hypothetical protein